MAEYDLTQKLLAYVDPHLGLRLLSHLSTKHLFDAKDLAKAQYELAKHTSLVDDSLQFHQQAYPGEPVPEALNQLKSQVEEKRQSLQKEAERVFAIIEDPSVASALKQDKTPPLEWLQQNHQLTVDQIQVLYQYGRFLFSCGDYSKAASYLYHYHGLVPDSSNNESVLWGQLACYILTEEWERALEALVALREHIDSLRVPANTKDTPFTHEDILQKRVWLLHWSLFVFFHHAAGRVKLVELYLSPAYLNALQMSCWWLLRYLVAAVLLTRRAVPRGYVVESHGTSNKLSTQAALREVSKVIQMESYRLQPDAVVDFFRLLYAELDFEGAQTQLAKATELATTDVFLQPHADAFVEQARFLVSEVYCRIHQKIDIADLAARLNLSRGEGDKWVEKLVAETKADAQINVQEGVVLMNQNRPVLYQSVIDKTRGIALRTSALAQAIERRAGDAQRLDRKAGDEAEQEDAEVDVDDEDMEAEADEAEAA
ncbi:eukaryotic translation initiation factor 3 subunit E [Malassezia equina]|uniref:Eukaryotic translation initiation factor 3 subunit E n=1 Tax=Malassezia equina TaxID=1381935 RepID=A0AAF0EHR1_9BASI|nr:eukaryotic translation initiation factor 3 subunit E [Malassezia equina]